MTYSTACGQLDKNLRVASKKDAGELGVNIPQIRTRARKGKYPDIRHLVIKNELRITYQFAAKSFSVSLVTFI